MSVNFKLAGLCLALFFLSSTSLLYAQSVSVPFDKVFRGGEKAYAEILRKHVNYSKSAIQNKTQGALVYAITLSRNGEVYIKFLTRLDNDIEKSVTKALNRTEGMWKEVAEPVTYYHAIYFGIGKSLARVMEEEETFRTDFQTPWLSPATVTALATIVTTGVSPSGARPSPPPTVPSYPDAFREYSRAVSQFNKQVKKGKAKKAYKALNSAIRYNPFNKELIEARIQLNRELGLSDFIESDKALLTALSNN